MFDPAKLPNVAEDEDVARFLMYSKWIRADETVKYEAFMPPDDLELSVTRLLQATETELWDVGAKLAAETKRTLHGRADMSVKAFSSQKLSVQSDPLPDNTNHAKVTGWPLEKAGQMMVAKLLAATPGLRRIPVPAHPLG